MKTSIRGDDHVPGALGAAWAANSTQWGTHTSVAKVTKRTPPTTNQCASWVPLEPNEKHSSGKLTDFTSFSTLPFHSLHSTILSLESFSTKFGLQSPANCLGADVREVQIAAHYKAVRTFFRKRMETEKREQGCLTWAQRLSRHGTKTWLFFSRRDLVSFRFWKIGPTKELPHVCLARQWPCAVCGGVCHLEPRLGNMHRVTGSSSAPYAWQQKCIAQQCSCAAKSWSLAPVALSVRVLIDLFLWSCWGRSCRTIKADLGVKAWSISLENIEVVSSVYTICFVFELLQDGECVYMRSTLDLSRESLSGVGYCLL